MVNWAEKTGYRMLPIPRKDSAPNPMVDLFGKDVSKYNASSPIPYQIASALGFKVSEAKNNKYARMIYNWNMTNRFKPSKINERRFGSGANMEPIYFDKPSASIELGRDRLGNTVSHNLDDQQYHDFVRDIGLGFAKRLDGMRFNIDNPTEVDMLRLKRVRSIETERVRAIWKQRLLKERREEMK
jgi:hypothetical protein